MQHLPFSGHSFLLSPTELYFRFELRQVGDRAAIILSRGMFSATCHLGPVDSQNLEDALTQILCLDGECEMLESVAAR